MKKPKGFLSLIPAICLYQRKIVRLYKFWFRKIGKERLFLLVVVFFAAVSFLVVVENDFDGEIWDMGNGILYAEEARVQNVPLIDYLLQKFPEGNVATNMYETGIMFIPLWQSLVYSGLKLFRSISFSVRFWLAIIGFSTVITLYFIGRKIYGSRVGLLAAITLATSIFYIIHVKSGFGYYAIMPLLVLLLFYFFYIAHLKKEKKFLYLSGIIIFLLLFNGWPTMVLAAQVMAAFVILNFRFKNILQLPKSIKTVWSQSLDGKGKSNLLGLRDYFLMLLIGGGLFFFFGVLYAWYFKGPIFDVFDRIYIYWYSSRATWVKHGQFLDPSVFFPNVVNLIKSFFWKMPFDEKAGYLTTLISPEAPMVTPFTALFFLMGIMVLIKRRLLFDKFCLIWLFFQIIGTTIYAGFTARNWLFSVTCIALVTAVGIDRSLNFLLKRLSRRRLGMVLGGIIVLGLVFSIVSTYYYYFFYFVRHNSFLGWAAQQSELGKYIVSVADPEDTVIVFDYFATLPKDTVRFYSSGKNYESYYYWSEITDTLEENTPENLLLWEQKILSRKKKIIYLISQGNYSHFPRGHKLWGIPDTSAFQTLHADLPPAKTIYYTNNVPAFKIYIVTREDIPLDKIELELEKNSDYFFWTEMKGKVDFLELEGPLTSGKICLNENCLSFLSQIRPGERLKLGRDYSQIIFTPLLDLSEGDFLIAKRENIIIEQQDDSFYVTSTAPKGYIVYKIKNLAPIKHVLFQTYPRINHDKEGKNKLTMQFSEDGIKYRTIYQIKSHKGRYWEWPYDKVATHAIKANSKEVYIKFIFEGKTGEAQLWSKPSNLTQFTAIGEGWLTENLKLNKGINKVKFEAREKHLEIAISSKGRISEIMAFDFIKQKIKQAKRYAQLEKGFYRLWMETKMPQEIKYDFIDFYQPGKGIVNVNQYISKSKELGLDFWAIVPNDKIFTADKLSKVSGEVVDDPFSLAKKVIYLGSEGKTRGEILNKSFELREGQYFLKLLARFKEAEKSEVAKVEICSEKQSQAILKMDLANRNPKSKYGYREFIAPFEIKAPRDIVNLKVEFLGNSKLWLDSVELVKVEETIEAETLSISPSTRVVDDSEASGGKAVYQSLKDLSLSGHIFFGDLKAKLPAGDYLTFYKMKVKNNAFENSLIRIENVSVDFNYATRDIWASDFRLPDEYQYFSLSLAGFSPESPLSFRGLWYPRISDTWIDTVFVGKIIRKYQFEELLPNELLVYDRGAEKERAVLFQSERGAEIVRAGGVLYSFTSDNFHCLLRMKMDSTSKSEDIALVRLFNLSTGEEIGRRKIRRLDFPKGNRYQDILFEIQKGSRGPIEFKIDLLTEGSLWLDYIDLISLD